MNAGGPDRPATPALRRGPQDEAPVSIERPPPLARLAALCALFDLFWNRIAVRLLAGRDQDAAILWQRFGVFPRNLAAVAGLVALSAALFSFLRMAGYSGLTRRLAISAVSGLLLPAFVLALVLPKERVSMLVVLVALAAANVMAVLVGTAAVQFDGGPRRWASAFATASAALVLTVLVVMNVRSIAETAAALPLGIVAHHGGELAWHAVPILGALALWRTRTGAPLSEGPSPRPALLAVVVALVIGFVALSLFGQVELHVHRFSTLVYGAFGLTLLPELASWVYAIPVGIGVGAALLGLFGRSGPRAQVGAALALWLAAGFFPRTPGQLLDFILAAVLLARASQAASVVGRERARARWAPLFARANDPT